MNLPKPKCATYYATVLYGEWLFLTTSHPPGSWPGRSERNRKLPSFPAATTNQARNKRSATVLQRYHYGITPMPLRYHSHGHRDAHGSDTVAIPVQYRWYTLELPSDHRRSGDNGKRIPRTSLFAHWTPEPKDENIQHPTTNLEHPCGHGAGKGSGSPSTAFSGPYSGA